MHDRILASKTCVLIILALLFASCAKDEMLKFDAEKDGVQFEYKKDQYKTVVDFAFQYKEVEDEWGYPMPHYYGDSIQIYQLPIIVSLVGHPSDKDRQFKLKSNQGEGLSPELVELDESYTFRAGRLVDTIQVTVKRPQQRGVFNAALAFDTEDPQSDFILGVAEKINFNIQIKDQYSKPEDWDGREAWLGEFSEEKYAFIVSVLHITYGYYTDWGQYNAQLRDELALYNQRNPQNPKTFSFPVNTDSIWWY